MDTLKDIEALYAERELGDPDEMVIVFANNDDIDHTSEWLTAIVERHPTAKQQVEILKRVIAGGHDMELSAIAEKLGLEGDVTEEQVFAKLEELKSTKIDDKTDDKTDLEGCYRRLAEILDVAPGEEAAGEAPEKQ
ncbi:hypothetical protein LCGC14_2753540 [marine sediment metagenome]|uniref:Uncharacterized protein n=1 Tax=marine sediment metagenome TaxID=412755 RepID=A0A0F8Z120_9ZZZZ